MPNNSLKPKQGHPAKPSSTTNNTKFSSSTTNNAFKPSSSTTNNTSKSSLANGSLSNDYIREISPEDVFEDKDILMMLQNQDIQNNDNELSIYNQEVEQISSQKINQILAKFNNIDDVLK
ncbi:3448_t:CDS:2, partial [Cetraspora pellucida]